MKKEISLPVTLAVIAAVCLIAVAVFVVREKVTHPVYHLGPGDRFDMKSGKVIKAPAGGGSAATGAMGAPGAAPR
jgi:hypothetical protein